MVIDWDTTPHYTIRFTSSGEADMTDESGAAYDAFNGATSRALTTNDSRAKLDDSLGSRTGSRCPHRLSADGYRGAC